MNRNSFIDHACINHNEMKNVNVLRMSIFTTTILCFIGMGTATAQKLPSKQKGGLRAPVEIKIDGKVDEWDGAYQAYNPVNRMFYTLSNDDDHLYLTVYLSEEHASSKMMKGGLTFLINSASKGIADVSVTYPAVSKWNTEEHERLVDSPKLHRSLRSEKNTDQGRLDSLVDEANQIREDQYKIIQVAGIEGVDPLISIYNVEEIQVATSLDGQMGFTYELALPLKYVEKAVSNDKFNYTLRVNHLPTVQEPGLLRMDPPVIQITANTPPDDLYYNYVTDFSGEYTLVKD